jgi:hypothetical protein
MPSGDSQIDIVRVGEAIRPSAKKKMGTIVIPVFIDVAMIQKSD